MLALAMRATKRAEATETPREVLNQLEAENGLAITTDSAEIGDEVAILDLDAVVPSTVPSDAPELFDLSGDLTFQPVSPYPYVLRDVAVWVPSETGADEVERIICNNVNEWLTHHYLFDEYEPSEGAHTSYAFRLVFQSYEKTLSDEEVNEVMGRVYAALQDMAGWEIR
jgi:phenylalanyl-tRNA synthetase beta subunit